MSKQFAVLGLGSFGWSVALTLEKPEALEALGGRNLDGAVVAVSENFEASIMATMLCKDMGIPKVLAKAKDKLQGTILKKVGADAVVYPEIEMGSRVAKNLVAKEFSDWIELSDDYSMVEAVVPEPWQGKCLAELRVRERFGINVVGIIINKQVDVTFDPMEPLPENAILIMIGANDILQKFDARKGKR